MRSQSLALVLLGVALGFPLMLLVGRRIEQRAGWIEVRGRVAENGGWSPENLKAVVGEELQLRLTSDDVVHGFAVGQQDADPIDLDPGRVVETSLTFTHPGKYVFYCTRWCGPGHWRMRGTIEVSGPEVQTALPQAPLYLTLGLDLDAPHPADPAPAQRPSARRGEVISRSLGVDIPSSRTRTQSPVQVWSEWRVLPLSQDLTDQQLWDLVAFQWKTSTSEQALEQGAALYAANCAACHGETGGGDGVMAQSLTSTPNASLEGDYGLRTPADFSDAQAMLGASPAVLQGKIVRGGMGTGMPYWGPIFTEQQTWDLVDYLWSFVYDY